MKYSLVSGVTTAILSGPLAYVLSIRNEADLLHSVGTRLDLRSIETGYPLVLIAALGSASVLGPLRNRLEVKL